MVVCDGSVHRDHNRGVVMPRKGYKQTEEHRLKSVEHGMRFKLIGHSQETKDRLSESATLQMQNPEQILVRKQKCGHSGSVVYHHTDGAKQSISKSHSGENAYNWAGDNVSYRAIHTWARKNLPLPDRCPICNDDARLQCCNNDHKYRRVISDWFYACQRCHTEHDKSIVKHGGAL